MAYEYHFEDDESDDVAACSCCAYPAETRVSKAAGGYPERLICQVCDNTMLGVIVLRTGADHDMARSIGWIANKLLDELRAVRKLLEDRRG